MTEAGPSKKPFLRRGEGTTRRVYAFKYKDQAKKKREENQRAAMERAAIRSSNDAIPDFSHTLQTNHRAADDSKTELESLLDISVQDGVPREEKEQKTDVGLVDGSCRVETRDEGMGDGVVRTKGERQDAWLESQRRHEEAQWEEAMALREFESLERRIVEETRSKLEKAEDVFKAKHVTFCDIPAAASPRPHTEGAKIAKARSKDRVQNRGSVQRVKSLRARRQEKSKDSGRIAEDKGSHKGGRLTSKSPSSEAQSPSPFGMNVGHLKGEENIVVDASFLDRLIEKDFYDVCRPCTAGRSDRDQEGLRLQSMREAFEQEKKDWQQRQDTAAAQFEAMKTEEMKKIKRERRVLEQQSKALLKLPSKKERSEIESLEALLETERKESRSKEARHKLTVERLRDQIQHLQVETTELREEVKWYEGMQLKGTQKRECRSAMTSPVEAIEIGVQTDVEYCDEHIAYPDTGMGDKWALRMENPFYSETSTQESLSKTEAVPSIARPSGREEMSALDQPSWISEPWIYSQMPPKPSGFPDCPHSIHTSHPLGDSRLMGGILGMDNGYGVHTLDAGYGRGCAFAGQQMGWIPSYSYPGYFPPSIAQPTVPCHPMSSYTFQPMTTDNTFGYPLTARPASDVSRRRGGHQGEGMGYDGRSRCGSDWKQGSITVDGQHPSIVPSTHPILDPVPSLLPGSYAVDCPSITPPPAKTPIPLERQELGLPLPKTVTAKTTLPADSLSKIPSAHRVQDCRTRDSASAVETSRPSSTSQHHMEEAKTVASAKSQSTVNPNVSTFDNGTIKQSYKDGRVVVWFGNSDVKHVHPCGRVEYLYADLNTWQVTYSNNVDVFYFDIGQVEGHKPNGDKDIVFPDGTVRTVFADGREVDVSLEAVTDEVRRPKPEIPGNRPERRFHKRLMGKK